MGPENRDYPLAKSSKSINYLLVTYLKPATTDQQHQLYFFYQWCDIVGYKLGLDNNKPTRPILSTNRLPMTNNVDR